MTENDAPKSTDIPKPSKLLSDTNLEAKNIAPDPIQADRGLPEYRNPDDPVSHPSHYTRGQIEVWDFIVDQGFDYLRGSAVKYIARAGHKNPDMEVQDLEKAIEYLEKAIKVLEGRK